MTSRRSVLAAAASLSLTAPAFSQSRARTLRFVPSQDLTALDPIWTTAYVARDHGAMVFDTLYGTDSGYRPQPQMVEGHTVTDDGKTWTIRLRDGLRFHDGESVLAKDCVASLRRWGKRDAYGQYVFDITDELTAVDDRTLRFRLKIPFAGLPGALGKNGLMMPVIMPERLALTDPFTQVTEMVGSGPFRFLADERVVGSRAVYEKFAGYVPRSTGTVGGTAGPKIVNFDRVECLTQPDLGTAAAAIQTGEVDWVQTASNDLLPLLRRNRQLRLFRLDPLGSLLFLRMNFIHPPFDNPDIRRAVLSVISQEDVMMAVNGEDRTLWRTGVGVFCPQSPMASTAGLELVSAPATHEQAKAALQQAGYGGEPVTILVPMDVHTIKAACDVTADVLRRIGMNVDYQALDWGTVIQRRTSRNPPGNGGWSIHITGQSGQDQFDPAGHNALRANGANGWFGWPDNPRIEALRLEWLAASDEDRRRAICAEIQQEALRDVIFIPLGQSFPTTMTRADISGVLPGFPVFWNVKRG